MNAAMITDLKAFFAEANYEKLQGELASELSLEIVDVPDVIYSLDQRRLETSGLSLATLRASLEADYARVKIFVTVKLKRLMEEDKSGGTVVGTPKNFLLGHLVEFVLLQKDAIGDLDAYLKGLRIPGSSQYKKQLAEFYQAANRA